MHSSIYIYMFQILKNKRFNLFSITLCVQLFYIILYTEDEHFAKTLYEDLGLLPCTFLLFLDRLADTGLQEDWVHADKMRQLDLVCIHDPYAVLIRICRPNDILLCRFILEKDLKSAPDRISIKFD